MRLAPTLARLSQFEGFILVDFSTLTGCGEQGLQGAENFVAVIRTT
jgi:hypothetical protein